MVRPVSNEYTFIADLQLRSVYRKSECPLVPVLEPINSQGGYYLPCCTECPWKTLINNEEARIDDAGLER